MSRLLVSLLFLLPAAFAAPQPLAPRASAGCGKFQLLRGVTVPRTFKSGTKDRGYSIHTPSSYDSKKAYPIVIGFHGSDSIGLFFEVDTKLDDAKYSGEVSCLVARLGETSTEWSDIYLENHGISQRNRWSLGRTELRYYHRRGGPEIRR